MEGYSLVQAAEELVSAALKPLSRLKGDVTIEVIAALLVLALAPTLPDVDGDSSQSAAGMPDPAIHPEESTDDHGNRRDVAGQHGTGTITRPPPAKYAAMALQLGRDSGLQAEVESMIRAAGDDLAEQQWREAYLKVELWMAVVSVYNLWVSCNRALVPCRDEEMELMPQSTSNAIASHPTSAINLTAPTKVRPPAQPRDTRYHPGTGRCCPARKSVFVYSGSDRVRSAGRGGCDGNAENVEEDIR
jgi:hypothetical protein